MTAMGRKKVDRPRIPGAPYTVDQAAAELNLAPRTVRKRIAEGKLRAYKDGHLIRVGEGDLAEYKSGLMPGRAPGPSAPLPLRRHLKTKGKRA